ncbi:hemerythrin domain-containing protein [Alicyclobacillus sp. SO9]|uniref:hemerythrin domain-containing protein n=1 Tax=Alicyclobacillus sp. SO9 TaxID=2665646 RepID=UPI0018E89036|nr:hemerythrin domain-containing protein [Alicyclobacillus sp. SO9]QQE78668.1 hemerythrin domain-containing protein [Alicyclobacillus sp. SO9]
MAGIKRHEALQELSRHHHHALVVAMNLKRAQIEDVTKLRQEVIQFWDDSGNHHFREEEDVLLPTYAKYKDLQDDENVIRMLIEHVQIRMLVQTIRDGMGDEGEVRDDAERADRGLKSRDQADTNGDHGTQTAPTPVPKPSVDNISLNTFHKLGGLLKGHVQLEEQVIFTQIQETVPEPDLFAIQHFFHEM